MPAAKSIVRYVEEWRGHKTACWTWKRAMTRLGYGQATWRGKVVVAHRALYEEHRGPIPDGLTFDHLCRNRDCVNPDHLEPVTHAENCRRAATTKLTAAAVREIRKRLDKEGRGAGRRLAAEYGVTPQAISNIKRERAWRGV